MTKGAGLKGREKASTVKAVAAGLVLRGAEDRRFLKFRGSTNTTSQ